MCTSSCSVRPLIRPSLIMPESMRAQVSPWLLVDMAGRSVFLWERWACPRRVCCNYCKIEGPLSGWWGKVRLQKGSAVDVIQIWSRYLSLEDTRERAHRGSQPLLDSVELARRETCKMQQL